MKIFKYLFTISLSVFLFSFLSCNDVIFADIRNEVELDDSTISGSIVSIVRYKDDIYVANGEIYHQPASSTSSSWRELATPGTSVYQLAADSDNLYAVSLSYEDDDDGYNVADKRILYKYDGSKWTTLLTMDYTSNYFFIFCTNTPKKDHRKAFLRYGSSVYDLASVTENSTSVSGWTEITADSVTVLGSSIGDIKSATYLGKVILSPYRASTSNETEDDDATYIYTASGETIYYSKDAESWSSVSPADEDILSMGFTKNYMLLGTDEGIEHVEIKDDVPSGSTSDFNNNAQSALSSYYMIEALLVADPSQNEDNTPIFASVEFDGSSSSTSATLENVGLWAYYPNEGEWNRE